ncbi:MAG: right-handed parallel beta-helix repeat-containing protein [Planctomycetes bacterium]|nr:right-handed parallel beta-helix repeat-containing protein [Planctomycetota bacterium]
MRRLTRRCVAFFFAALSAAGASVAEDLYVDDVLGRDTANGRFATPVDPLTGPVRTIGRALRLAGTGDTIVIKNNGRPYYESLAMDGRVNSGSPLAHFTIEGNGAVVDGSAALPPNLWRKAGEDLWKLTPWKKGWYLLLDAGRPLAEHECPREAHPATDLPAGHWCAWEGSIYLRLEGFDEPRDRSLALAARGVGLSLYNVRHATIRNLTFQHFQRDGANAHDLCRDVVLENVRLLENGRAGLAAGGTSAVLVQGCEIAGNRRHSVLISEKAGVAIDDASALSAEPTVLP